jgi:hypothetical protein
MSTERSLTYSSTFNWEESNLKELLKEVKFSIMKRNDESGMDYDRYCRTILSLHA